MTEELLDALRTHAAVIDDEGGRLVRSLKGSSAVEATVREHLANCLKACTAMDAVMNPAVVFAAQVVETATLATTETRTAPVLPQVPPNRELREDDTRPLKKRAGK